MCKITLGGAIAERQHEERGVRHGKLAKCQHSHRPRLDGSHSKQKGLSFVSSCAHEQPRTLWYAYQAGSRHLMTSHRSRPEYTVHLHVRHPTKNANKQHGNGKSTDSSRHRQPHRFADHSGATTHLHFDGETLINTSESFTQTQLGNPPWLLEVLLLVHWYLTENLLHMGEESHDVTALSGTPLRQLTRAVRLLRYQKISL